MTKIIAIMNAKGGTGKTTTAMNLSAYLAIFQKKVLLIDFDVQFNATIGLGVNFEKDETIYHVLLANQKIEKVIKKTYLTNFDIIPASYDLAGALVELVNLENREYYLRNVVEQLRGFYDFILIDLGPSLNLLTINGLLASDEVIIPIQCEYYSLEGLNQLLEIIDLIKNNLKHNLKVRGALLTMYDKRERLSREVAREVRKRFPYYVFEVEIPRSIALAEAPSFKKPVVLYAPQSIGALAYERLARELIEQIEKEKNQNLIQEEYLTANLKDNLKDYNLKNQENLNYNDFQTNDFQNSLKDVRIEEEKKFNLEIKIKEENN